MFLDVLDSHAPIRSKRVRKRPSLPWLSKDIYYLSWLSKDIRDKMLEHDRPKRLAMIKKDDVSWAKYRSSRNIVNVALRKAKSAFYASEIENVTGNPKKAWKTVNDILGRKQRTDDVREIKIKDHSVTSPEEILPVVSKVFERILYKQLVEYLDAENLLSEHQFGFRCSHSTVSALLDCSNEWYCNMDRGLYNLVIFLDL